MIAVNEILLPRTDAGALTQVVVVFAATVLATWAVRRERSLVLLTAGLGMTVLGLMALRTLH